MGVFPPARYRPAFITMGSRRKCCEKFSRIIIAGPCWFPCNKSISGDPNLPLINTCTEFPDDTCFLHEPDPFHYLVATEVQSFSNLFEGSRDEREPLFQFPEYLNINRIHG
jgi:hypothetical protein